MTHVNTKPSTSNSRTTRGTVAIGVLSVATLLVPAAASAIDASGSTPVETRVPPTVTVTVAAERIEHPLTADTIERRLAAKQHQRVAACRATYRTADMLERCIEAEGD
jgi:hypothetical protein